jgi:hypothetical protein
MVHEQKHELLLGNKNKNKKQVNKRILKDLGGIPEGSIFVIKRRGTQLGGGSWKLRVQVRLAPGCARNKGASFFDSKLFLCLLDRASL